MESEEQAKRRRKGKTSSTGPTKVEKAQLRRLKKHEPTKAAAYEQHLAEVIPGPPEYNFGLDPTLAPCCHGSYNATIEREYIENHEWSLALWEKLGCVCNP